MLNEGGRLIVVDLDSEDGRFHASETGFDGHNGFDQQEFSRSLREAGFRDIGISTFYHGEKEIGGKPRHIRSLSPAATNNLLFNRLRGCAYLAAHPFSICTLRGNRALLSLVVGNKLDQNYDADERNAHNIRQHRGVNEHEPAPADMSLCHQGICCL